MHHLMLDQPAEPTAVLSRRSLRINADAAVGSAIAVPSFFR